ncbi:hypothetical protein EC843_105114 [Buttiauxella sp. JUb87]|nr:hypothetical protein EC843_105114 [Buttiauxella sp. JUb87]
MITVTNAPRAISKNDPVCIWHSCSWMGICMWPWPKELIPLIYCILGLHRFGSISFIMISLPCSFIWTAFTQPKWINPLQRIRHIPVRVHPTRQPYRVCRNILPRLTIIVTGAVVVQAGFCVFVLPRKAQSATQLVIIRTFFTTPELLLAAPDDGAVFSQ